MYCLLCASLNRKNHAIEILSIMRLSINRKIAGTYFHSQVAKPSRIITPSHGVRHKLQNTPAIFTCRGAKKNIAVRKPTGAENKNEKEKGKEKKHYFCAKNSHPNLYSNVRSQPVNWKKKMNIEKQPKTPSSDASSYPS